jgi:hypothetical protein
MLTALSLAALLAAAPTGTARLDQGTAGVNLRLTSFETERVAVPKRGTFTSAELLFRSPSGERLDLRFLYKGAGELPAKNVTSIVAQTKAGGLSRWTSAKGTGCRVKLYKAAPEELAGKLECRSPEAGEPFEAVFDAKR